MNDEVVCSSCGCRRPLVCCPGGRRDGELARAPSDTVVSLIVDAAEQPGLAAERLRLAAVHASSTVRLDFVMT